MHGNDVVLQKVRLHGVIPAYYWVVHRCGHVTTEQLNQAHEIAYKDEGPCDRATCA